MPAAPPAGAPLAGPYPTYSGSSPSGYGPSPWEVDRRRQIERTKWAFLLVLIGSLVYWIPSVGIIGYILFIIGAILALIGRKAFGPVHSRNVILSVVVFCVGIATVIVGAFVAGLIAVASLGPSPTQARFATAVRDALTNALIVAAIGTVAYLFAAILFTYSLQRKEGRVLLWVAYAAAVGVQVATVLVLLPLIPGIADQAASAVFAGGQYDPTRIATAFNVPTSSVGLLNVIPAMLFGAASYLAWSRINRGEIPPPMAPPGMPTPPTGASPPAPPINPM